MDVEDQEQSNTNAFRKWGQKRWVLWAAVVATLIILANVSRVQGPASQGIVGWFQSSLEDSFSSFRSHQILNFSSPEDDLSASAKATSPPNPEYFAPPSPGQGWPPSNNLSRQMMDFNERGPWRNSNATQSRIIAGITPTTVPIVVYVHNRPAYLREVFTRLSQVDGIEEVLLIVSHDGYFPEVVAVVREFTFMRIKQIFAPVSPHNFKDSFPAHSPDQCPEKPAPKTPAPENCTGNPDQHGNFRNPFFVGLKVRRRPSLTFVLSVLQQS